MNHETEVFTKPLMLEAKKSVVAQLPEEPKAQELVLFSTISLT